MSEILEKTHPELVKALKTVGLNKVYVDDTPLGNLSIWDGFVSKPEYSLQRFGVKKDDYPTGCYATFWVMTQGERGSPNAMVGYAVFSSLHNAGFSLAERQNMRVSALIDRAKEEFRTAEKIRTEERHGLTG